MNNHWQNPVVTLGIGQRTDVLITGLPGANGSYTMRSSLSAVPCSLSNKPDATAIVYYLHDALALGTPNTTAWPAWTNSVQNQCANASRPQTPSYNHCWQFNRTILHWLFPGIPSLPTQPHQSPKTSTSTSNKTKPISGSGQSTMSPSVPITTALFSSSPMSETTPIQMTPNGTSTISGPTPPWES